MAQPVEFFAYGSLLDQRLMREMVGEWDSLSTARLPDHKLRFSRYSEEWKGATADLEPARGESVYGVIYRIFSYQFLEIGRRFPGYVERRIVVEMDEGLRPATTLVVGSPEAGLKPSDPYIKAIAEGMRQHGFAPSIRETLWRWTGSSGTGAP